MASEEAIQKMIRAIMDKRRQLGIQDWGMVPVEEVIDKLNRQSLPQDQSSPGENLVKDAEAGQNNPVQKPKS